MTESRVSNAQEWNRQLQLLRGGGVMATREHSKVPSTTEVSTPTPPESDEDLNHILLRADMAKTEGIIKGLCGTELEPWSGQFAPRGTTLSQAICVVCWDLARIKT